MEATAATNHVASGEDTSAVSSLPTSPSLHVTSGTVSNNNFTCIARQLYIAAVEGNFQEFINIQNLENLLTPNKNTILHIHLTSSTTQTTQNVGLWHDIDPDEPTIFLPRGTPVSEEFVNQILDKCGGLVLLLNTKGETLLHIAARYGHSNIAKLLVGRVKDYFPSDIENGITIGTEKKKFIRATNNEKDTALHEAVRYEHIQVVKTLLELDPDYSSYANNANQTPLYLASERQNQQMVREILNKVKSPAYDGPNSQTALHVAVINQDAVMAVDLLKNEHVRLAVKQADKEGWVPLHYAVKAGNRDLTKLLLEQNENTAYMQDNEGRTALHIAAYSGFADIMEMIINYYPDCSELVDNKGKNALHYSVSGSRLATADKIMLNLSLSNLYNEKDIDGNTPLHYFAKNYLICDRLVFHRRVDRLAVNKKEQTALDVAYDNIENENSTILRKQIIKNQLTMAGAKRSLPLGQKLRNGPEQSLGGTVFTKEAKESQSLGGTVFTKEAKESQSLGGTVITKEAKESHLLVATLIAALSFAAGITLPGGTIQEGEYKGSPVLGHRASFKAFIVSNTLAMVMAASAAFIHLFTPLIKEAKRKDFLSLIASALTSYAVQSIVVTYATATYAVLGSSSLGIAVIIIGLSLFLVCFLIISVVVQKSMISH